MSNVSFGSTEPNQPSRMCQVCVAQLPVSTRTRTITLCLSVTDSAAEPVILSSQQRTPATKRCWLGRTVRSNQTIRNRRHEYPVIEMTRPPRAGERRLSGKSDVIDAENAARQVIAGKATAIPKKTEGNVESIRLLKIVRDTAVKPKARPSSPSSP